MPDVERSLVDLRDELSCSVPVPDLDTVAERYRQRRTRLRMQVGAVAAVLVVSATVPILRQLDAPSSPAAPPPVTSTSPRTHGLRIYADVQFAQDGSAYALRTRCQDPVGDRQPRCELTVLASTDLQNWTEIGPALTYAPATASNRDDVVMLGRLIVLGPSELVVEQPDTADGIGSGAPRLHSADGGRTWRNVPTPIQVTDVVASIPSGAQLLPACFNRPGTHPPCGTPTFTMVRPGTGTSAVLADPPPLVDPIPGAIPTAGGHWWAVGRQPRTRAWAISVSTDDGRTWQTDTLDVDPREEAQVSVSSHDGTLYASVTAGEPFGSFGLRAVLRSDDDGRSWRRTWRPSPGTENDIQAWGDLVAADDGTVRLHENTRTYVFSDGGRTLGLDSQERLGPVRWAGAGYLSLGVSSFELSTDGLSWREYQLPPV